MTVTKLHDIPPKDHVLAALQEDIKAINSRRDIDAHTRSVLCIKLQWAADRIAQLHDKLYCGKGGCDGVGTT